MENYRATNLPGSRDESFRFRISKRLLFFAGLAARARNSSTSNYIEQLIEADWPNADVNPQESLSGPASAVSYSKLGDIADALWDDDEVSRLQKQQHFPFSLSSEQSKVLTLMRVNKRISFDEVREHWDVLMAVLRKKEPISSLPEKLTRGCDAEFALMGDAERITLYRENPEEFTKRSQRHLKEANTTHTKAKVR